MIYFAKIVTQNILSQGTSNLQIDFKYQSRRNYQYLIISITFTCVPVYWVSNLPVWGHRVPGFLSHTEFHPRYSVPKWSPRNKENIIKSLSKHGKWCTAYFRYELSNNFLFFLQLIGKLSIKSNPHSLARSKTPDHHFVEALYMKFLFRFSFYLTCLFVFRDFHFYYNSAISNCKNHSNAVCS